MNQNPRIEAVVHELEALSYKRAPRNIRSVLSIVIKEAHEADRIYEVYTGMVYGEDRRYRDAYIALRVQKRAIEVVQLEAYEAVLGAFAVSLTAWEAGEGEVGTGGRTTLVTLIEGQRAASFRWWEDPPAAWQALAEATQQAMSAIDGAFEA